MNGDCQTCGALWRVHPLSRVRSECPRCEKSICAKCEQVRCFRCDVDLHAKCAVMHGEDLYCPACAEREVRIDMLLKLSTEELLVASVAVEQYRKSKREAA